MNWSFMKLEVKKEGNYRKRGYSNDVRYKEWTEVTLDRIGRETVSVKGYFFFYALKGFFYFINVVWGYINYCLAV